MIETSVRDIIEESLAEDLLIAPVAEELKAVALEWSLSYCEPASNSSLRIDLDGPLAIGRLTLWSTGNLYLEALRIADGAQIICANIVVTSSKETVGVLKVLAAVVAHLPSNNSFKPTPLRGAAEFRR